MDAINIRLAKNHDGTSEFIEIEDDNRRSVRIGEIKHEGSYYLIRITPEDIKIND